MDVQAESDLAYVTFSKDFTQFSGNLAQSERPRFTSESAKALCQTFRRKLKSREASSLPMLGGIGDGTRGLSPHPGPAKFHPTGLHGAAIFSRAPWSAVLSSTTQPRRAWRSSTLLKGCITREKALEIAQQHLPALGALPEPSSTTSSSFSPLGRATIFLWHRKRVKLNEQVGRLMASSQLVR